MAHLTYFVLCENYLFNDGKTTLVNIYDTVNASEFPAVVKNFVIAMAIKDVNESDLVDGKIKAYIELVGEKKPEEVIKMDLEQEITNFPANVTSSVDLGGKIQFIEETHFTGKLYLNKQHMGTLTFEVKKA